jgi:competence protein ComEC
LIKDIRAVPVFRLLCGLLGGILLSRQININLTILLSGLGFLIFAMAAVYFGRVIRKPGHEWFNGFMITLFYILLGFVANHAALKDWKFASEPISGTFTANVLSSPVLKEKSTRIEVEILNRVDTLSELYRGVRALIYIENSHDKTIPDMSDKFIFRGELRIPVSPANPGEFDYAGFLRTKGIFFTCFLKAGEWRIIGKDQRFSISNYALQIRQKLWNKISSVDPDNPNLSVLYALALGAKDLLDKDTMESYTASGTMHVLSVSGLHVGLIWMVISQIILFLKRLPCGVFFYFIIGFFLLWFYADRKSVV